MYLCGCTWGHVGRKGQLVFSYVWACDQAWYFPMSNWMTASFLTGESTSQQPPPAGLPIGWISSVHLFMPGRTLHKSNLGTRLLLRLPCWCQWEVSVPKLQTCSSYASHSESWIRGQRDGPGIKNTLLLQRTRLQFPALLLGNLVCVNTYTELKMQKDERWIQDACYTFCFSKIIIYLDIFQELVLAFHLVRRVSLVSATTQCTPG